jgi:DNA repair protein RecO (recombination protein O)
MKTEKSEGLVLRSMDYKERSRIITLFTKESGLLSLIVKGLSKKNYSLFSITSPFCQAEFIYIPGRSDLFRYQDSTLVNAHLLLRGKLEHLQAAGELAQAILYSQLPGKPAPDLYTLLISYLQQITCFENPLPLIASFHLKILNHEGLLARSVEGRSQASFFSDEEWLFLEPLIYTRSFKQLHALTLQQELASKIKAHFKKQIRQE